MTETLPTTSFIGHRLTEGKLAYPFYMCYYFFGSVMSCQRDMQSVVNSAKEKWIREYR